MAFYYLSPELKWALQISAGLFWTLVYLLIIKRGFQDRALGMPLTALCANLSWEFIFSFIYPHDAPQIYINVCWFLFDLLILVQAIKFGVADFTKNLSSRLFYPAFALTLILSFGAVLSTTVEFKDWEGKYAAFGQNLMMSVLFVAMLLRRNDITGQSVYIALFKLLGTLLPSIQFYLTYPSAKLLNFLYVAILIYDAIYLILLYKKCRQLGVNPWTRF